MDKKIVRCFDCESNMFNVDFGIKTSDRYIENWCKVRGLEIFSIVQEFVKGSDVKC